MFEAAQRPKVLFVDHVARLSGGEIALVRLIEAFAGRVQVVVALGEDGPLRARLESAGAQVHVLPLHPSVRDVRKDSVNRSGVPAHTLIATARYVRELRKLIVTEQPDIVHTNSLKAAFVGGVAGRLVRKPVVWHIRDRIDKEYLPATAVQLVRWASRFIPTRIVANSHSTLSTLPATVQTAVIHSLVVYDSVAVQTADKPRSTTDGRFRFGVVGRIAPWKGQHIFLDAFARSMHDDEVAVLIGSPLFGEDDYLQQLHEQARALGLTDRVEFRGFREDVGAELARLDVLVHCSTSPEPFGQVIVEGMAAAVPVIAAAAGGPAEIVTHEWDGMLVRPDDPRALAEAMTQLRVDPNLRRKLAERGLRSAIRFSPEVSAGAMLEVYRNIMTERRGAAARRGGPTSGKVGQAARGGHLDHANEKDNVRESPRC